MLTICGATTGAGGRAAATFGCGLCDCTRGCDGDCGCGIAVNNSVATGIGRWFNGHSCRDTVGYDHPRGRHSLGDIRLRLSTLQSRAVVKSWHIPLLCRCGSKQFGANGRSSARICAGATRTGVAAMYCGAGAGTWPNAAAVAGCNSRSCEGLPNSSVPAGSEAACGAGLQCQGGRLRNCDLRFDRKPQFRRGGLRQRSAVSVRDGLSAIVEATRVGSAIWLSEFAEHTGDFLTLDDEAKLRGGRLRWD